MSVIPPALSQELRFYLSGPLPCPYLPGQVERKLFTRLSPDDPQASASTNGALCRAGFRRSHDVVYRPACTACNACVPVRLPVRFFTPSRSLKRIAVRNKDLSWHRTDAVPSEELFRLFSAYQRSRHGDSDMARMTSADFASMLQEGKVDTQLYQLRDAEGVLKGCMIVDPVGDGVSAVYSFYAADEARRSLGSALILALIAEAQRSGLSFVYLGYWIQNSEKMAYKTRFQPLEFLGTQGWNWLL